MTVFVTRIFSFFSTYCFFPFHTFSGGTHPKQASVFPCTLFSYSAPVFGDPRGLFWSVRNPLLDPLFRGSPLPGFARVFRFQQPGISHLGRVAACERFFFFANLSVLGACTNFFRRHHILLLSRSQSSPGLFLVSPPYFVPFFYPLCFFCFV